MSAIDVLRHNAGDGHYGNCRLGAVGRQKCTCGKEERAAALAAVEQLQQAAERVASAPNVGNISYADFDALVTALRAVRASDESWSQRPSAGREGE